ncbi:hypothetical protein [Microvirga sp. VF16]|uniref:hypothetical protein n=1 Tax=Microvirga sp. VF16 TaxID=2807101 RepID=UPI00193D506F|nr:hypothetical protein [Microvirga sp. VF16]QRM28329.1 hypothetical protein JO965_19105 [Microvirga sp. VF16]
MAKAKIKLPKTIAGMKVPKPLRKSAAVTSFLNDPVGRAVLADALIAAAGAAAATLAQHRPSGAQVAQAGETVVDRGGRAGTASADTVRSAVGSLGSIASEVVQSILHSGDRKASKGKRNKKHRNQKSHQTGDHSFVRHH